MPIDHIVIPLIYGYFCRRQFVVVYLFDTALGSVFEGLGEVYVTPAPQAADGIDQFVDKDNQLIACVSQLGEPPRTRQCQAPATPLPAAPSPQPSSDGDAAQR